MKKLISVFKIGLLLVGWHFPAMAQDAAQTGDLAGSVVANNKTRLSYEARGCITGLSKSAVKSGKATAGQMLVELDNRTAKLAVRIAQARVSDLKDALSEADFAITVAKSNVSRVNEEQSFVEREFERTRVLFQRGLVNETALETVERSKLNASFVVERSKEELKRATSARLRAQTALEIGRLDVQGRELELESLTVNSPFDGVLLNFKPKIGDCVLVGALAAEIYAPTEKNVETFLFVDQLVDTVEGGVTVGREVNITRVNGKKCPGVFSLISTEADLESQHVRTTIEIAESCAPDMFLNEFVGIEILPVRP
ncbi:HlyD family efflux transporter periplasmic adaptor subunit [bacterium]|nr:HlyD family efflux transporter periplasmic adaptor subunit [bacterium]